MTQDELARGLGSLADEGWIGRWSPGIGDPTLMGWLTVVLYLVAAWLCFSLVTGRRGKLRAGEPLLWWLLALGLLLLGINKQLDLQSALTELGRIMAIQQGWYAHRHDVQIRFIYGVVAAGIVATLGLAVLARRAPPATLLALGGSVCLLAFVAIRAASFHRVDIYIGSGVFGLKMNWILEMGSILIIVAGARWRLRGTRKVEREAPP